MQDAELAGNFISVEEIGKIFVLVNFESDKVWVIERACVVAPELCPLPLCTNENVRFLLLLSWSHLPSVSYCPQTTYGGLLQRSAEADVNEDRALMRFELMEALIRVAVTMRDNEGQDDMSPAEKVRPSVLSFLFLPSRAWNTTRCILHLFTWLLKVLVRRARMIS